MIELFFVHLKILKQFDFQIIVPNKGMGFLVAQTVKCLRSPGEGNGNTLQYSCLENTMNRGAW